MDPILADIYSTVAPSVPYLVAGYALLWAALLVFVLVTTLHLKRSEAQMALLEEEVARLRDAAPGERA